MPTELPLDALEVALWVRARAGDEVDGVVYHSDAGGLLRAPTACSGRPSLLRCHPRWEANRPNRAPL